MIYRKENYYDKLNKLTKDNFFVVSDFDRTITSSDSRTTWGVPSNCGVLSNEYDFERNSLYNYYRPIELDENLDEAVKMGAMSDWQQKHVELFKKYALSKKQIEEILSKKDIMIFRDKAIEFLGFLNSKKICLNILSAGLGDFIVSFFKNNDCNYKNINIKSNFLDFNKEDIVIGLKGDILHSLNKSEYAFQKKDKEYVLLIGDQLSDVMMVKGFKKDEIISVAFVPFDNVSEIESFKDVFDIVLTDDEGFEAIINDLESVIGK